MGIGREFEAVFKTSIKSLLIFGFNQFHLEYILNNCLKYKVKGKIFVNIEKDISLQFTVYKLIILSLIQSIDINWSFLIHFVLFN